MVHTRLSVILPLLLFAQAAWAAADDVERPCAVDPRSKGQEQEALLRCQLAVQADRITKLAAEADGYKAMLAITTANLERERRDAEMARAKQMQLNEWFNGWFGRDK